MTEPFNDPATGGGGEKLPLQELLGALLIFSVHEETGEILTEYGPAKAVRCDVAVLDGAHKGDTYNDTLIFPRKLQAQLRTSVGAKVLGRLAQGEKQPGKNPPWQLNPATDADKEVGRKYLTYLATQQPQPETVDAF
jgi:hypothetical protein